MKCVICESTIMPLEPTGILSKEKSKFKICSRCDKAKKGLLNIERGEINVSKEYFNKYLLNVNLNENAKKEIKNWIENAESRAEQKEYANQRSMAAEKNFNDNRKELLKYVTTANNFEGYKIVDYFGTVSGEIVVGTGFLSELDASFSDFFGEKSDTMAKKIAMAKTMAQESMVKKAAMLGGNAVIAIDYDIVTFNNNLIGILVNGTAVKIERINTDSD